jgi:hypothetical protein
MDFARTYNTPRTLTSPISHSLCLALEPQTLCIHQAPRARYSQLQRYTNIIVHGILIGQKPRPLPAAHGVPRYSFMMCCLIRTSFKRGSWCVAVTRAFCAAQTVYRTRSSWFHARTCSRWSGRCKRAPFVGWLPLVVHRGKGCLRLFTVDNPRGLFLRCLIVRPRPMLAGAARCVLQYIA